MRALEKVLLAIGVFCLVLWAVLTVQTRLHQAELERIFERELYKVVPAPAVTNVPRRTLNEGDLVGRLEIPRLDLSVMVMEGVRSRTLRLGAGRIPGTALPWTRGNVGIAAHRDTFFRDLREVQKNDRIRLTTVDGPIDYRVAWTSVVHPDDTDALKPTSEDMLTLVTCYPFYYVGPAPERFVVRAIRD